MHSHIAYTVIATSHLDCSLFILYQIFGIRKTRVPRLCVALFVWSSVGRTQLVTNGRTDRALQHVPRYSTASRGKISYNCDVNVSKSCVCVWLRVCWISLTTMMPTSCTTRRASSTRYVTHTSYTVNTHQPRLPRHTQHWRPCSR